MFSQLQRAAMVLLLIGFAWTLTGCNTTKPQDSKSPEVYKAATFTIQVPEGITGTFEQGEDYAVHYFRITDPKIPSSSMLGVYEGQRPRLFSKKEKNLTVMRRGSTNRASIERGDDVWGVDSNGKVWRESVWSCYRTITNDKGKPIRLPTMLHLWYFEATDDEQAVFDALANTIEMIE
jgi:hypothetical protein